MMQDNPPMKIEGTSLDRVLETIALLLLIVSVFYTVWIYTSLPETIPHHYNYKGKPDAWGSKNLIFVLLGIQLFQYFVITILTKYPHLHNYRLKITLENAEEEYRKSMRFMRGLKILLMILFFAIMYENAEGAMNSGGTLGWPFFASLVSLLAYIVFYILIQFKKRR